VRYEGADTLIKKFGPGTPGATLEDMPELMKAFGMTSGEVADWQDLVHSMGGSSAMPHTTKRRQKYDQQRTPWIRLAPREKEILDAGWAHVQSVPYKVSLRWLFYRLLQDGLYKGKVNYKDNFVKLFARARHTGQGYWRPDTLEDEGRNVVRRSGGCKDAADAVGEMKENIQDAAYVPIDHFYRQENYIELWYEANAMTSQFEHYTRAIDLVPMAGTASIPYKWKIAKRLEAAAVRYGKPIRILYFGDEDEAGHVIKSVIEKDVRRWSSTPFEVDWCGLTVEQAEFYGVPENFEKKGYQWEALPDDGAREIITAAVERYIDMDLIDEADEDAEEFREKWEGGLNAALNKIDKGGE